MMLRHLKKRAPWGHWILLLFLLLPYERALAQVMLTDTTEQKFMPFDIPFAIKYRPLRKTRVSDIALFQLDKRGCLQSPHCWPCAVQNSGGIWNHLRDPVAVSQPIRGFVQKDSGDVTFTMPPLKPNRRYMLTISSSIVPDSIEFVLAAFRRGVFNDPGLFNRISRRAAFTFEPPNGDCSSCGGASFPMGSFQDFIDHYNNELCGTMDSVDAETKKLEAIERKPPPLMDSIFFMGTQDLGVLSGFVTQAQVCLTCSDTLWQHEWLFRDPTRENLLRTISNLSNLSDTLVAYGYVGINQLHSLIPKSVKVPTRIENVQKDIELLGHVLELFNYLQLKYPAVGFPALERKLRAALAALKANHASLLLHNARIAATQKKIDRFMQQKYTRLAAWIGFQIPFSSVVSNSFTYKFDTRQTFTIRPDFGFMVYGNPWSNPDLKGFSPFLGFHVNFRPLNTDVPYRLIRCKGLHGHLSFHSGVLIGSFERRGQRDGLVGNTAIFTGLGWAFGHGVRLTGGAVWFRKNDPNPLESGKVTAATPYAGIALDLRLQDIYKSFTGLFTP